MFLNHRHLCLSYLIICVVGSGLNVYKCITLCIYVVVVHTVYPYLCCGYLENSFEVKVEAASNDITECAHDDQSSIGTLCFYTSATIRH